MRVPSWFRMSWLLLVGSGLLLTGPAFAQWPPGTSGFVYRSTEQETNLFLLHHYLNLPGNGLDLTSLDGLKKLPDLQGAISNPTTLKGRVGLGVNTSFSDPVAGRINTSWIPVFKTEENSGTSGNVLPKSISDLAPLSALLTNPFDQGMYLTHISDLETCPVDPSEASATGGSGVLPQVLITDAGMTDYAVVELKPDPENPNQWIPGAAWTAVRMDGTSVSAVTTKPKAIASKPAFSTQRYQAGPLSVPVGLGYAQNWSYPGLKRTVNHALSFQFNATQLNQSTLTYESRIPSLGKTGQTNIMALAIVQPMRQSALAGAAIQNRLNNGTSLNTFVGYETNKDDRAGHLIVQMTHTGKETPGRITHTTGFIARLGNTTEATGLYQLRSGPIIASAAVTPVRVQNLENPQEISSGMSVGASFTRAIGANPVTGFVNIGLLKDWAKTEGIRGEISAGVTFPRSRTTMYVVVPLDYFASQEGLGPRAQFNIPLNRAPASQTGK
jgi:hypothetical protein